MRYRINSSGNMIEADEAFVTAHYPNDYTAMPEPVTAAPVAPVRHVTRLAFLSRFTDAEAVGIDLASIGATAQAAGMRRYTNKVNAASYIDLDRADTRAGVQQLEAGGMLAAGRALVILDAPIAAHEIAS